MNNLTTFNVKRINIFIFYIILNIFNKSNKYIILQSLRSVIIINVFYFFKLKQLNRKQKFL